MSRQKRLARKWPPSRLHVAYLRLELVSDLPRTACGLRPEASELRLEACDPLHAVLSNEHAKQKWRTRHELLLVLLVDTARLLVSLLASLFEFRTTARLARSVQIVFY